LLCKFFEEKQSKNLLKKVKTKNHSKGGLAALARMRGLRPRSGVFACATFKTKNRTHVKIFF